MSIWNKQHLKNIWGSVHEKVKQHINCQKRNYLNKPKSSHVFALKIFRLRKKVCCEAMEEMSLLSTIDFYAKLVFYHSYVN